VTLALPPLMAIVDADLADRLGTTMIELAEAYLRGGAMALQIRAKNRPSGWVLDAASAIVASAHRRHAIAVVNDRADVAALAGADGVHIGQDDLPPVLARRIVGPEAIVGLSTHTREQLDAALAQPVNYVAIGPVFGTKTKATGYDSLGLDPVRRAAELARKRAMPLVAIGGITLERAADVLGAGAIAVAVISDLAVGGDPEARVREYVARLTV
jgi:thiamine-phosphate pyrophosphorylase